MRRDFIFRIFLFFWGSLHASVLCEGIVLLGDESAIVSNEKEDVGVNSFELDIPGPKGNLHSRLSDSFLGNPIDSALLSGLRSTIESFYQEQNHPLVEVIIPEQELTDGIIQVRVLESRIANVKVDGNPRTSSKTLKNYLGASRNDSINSLHMQNRIEFMNRNPFRHVDLVYSPGVDAHTTDVSLQVEDSRPVKFYAGADNIGVQTTGRGLCFAGVKCARMFSLDHHLSYQYTASEDFKSFEAHNIQYTAYLPWRNILSLFGGLSNIHAYLPFPSTTNKGQSIQASSRYTIPFSSRGGFSHEASVGFDFKRTNNTVEFSELYPVISSNVNLSQFVLGYEAKFGVKKSAFELGSELFFSPGALFKDASNANYQALRPEAKNHWVYGKAILTFVQQLPASFTFKCKARGQLSSQNLLPSEQIGLGGFDSVRGFDERQLNYDRGLLLNTELYAPAFALLSFFKTKRSWNDSLQFLAFIDFGYGGNHNLIPGENKHDYLVGIGPAARYNFGSWLSARLDLGVKLHNEEAFSGGNAMWYFSVVGNL